MLQCGFWLGGRWGGGIFQQQCSRQWLSVLHHPRAVRVDAKQFWRVWACGGRTASAEADGGRGDVKSGSDKAYHHRVLWSHGHLIWFDFCHSVSLPILFFSICSLFLPFAICTLSVTSITHHPPPFIADDCCVVNNFFDVLWERRYVQCGSEVRISVEDFVSVCLCEIDFNKFNWNNKRSQQQTLSRKLLNISVVQAHQTIPTLPTHIKKAIRAA